MRVRFVLQPALYFGVYEFPGAIRSFPYSRLLQISNYQSQEPYSAYDFSRRKPTWRTFSGGRAFSRPQYMHSRSPSRPTAWSMWISRLI